MLETLIAILLIMWLLGWLAWPIGGALIHLLLLVAVVVLVVRLLTPRAPLEP